MKEVGDMLGRIGCAFRELGRHNEALRMMEGALDFRRRILPNDHPHIATSMSNLAAVYGRLGRHEEALAVKRAAKSKKPAVGDDPSSLVKPAKPEPTAYPAADLSAIPDKRDTQRTFIKSRGEYFWSFYDHTADGKGALCEKYTLENGNLREALEALFSKCTRSNHKSDSSSSSSFVVSNSNVHLTRCPDIATVRDGQVVQCIANSWVSLHNVCRKAKVFWSICNASSWRPNSLYMAAKLLMLVLWNVAKMHWTWGTEPWIFVNDRCRMQPWNRRVNGTENAAKKHVEPNGTLMSGYH